MTDSSATTPEAPPLKCDFETPFTIEHVQGHLILGPIARHLNLATLAVFLFPLYIGWEWWHSEDSPLRFALVQILPLVMFAALFQVRKQATRQQQTIILWFSIKVTALFGCFILLSAGTMTQWFEEQSLMGALFCLTLGLTWMPGLEFIPRLTPHQKWITAGRITITLICVTIAVQQGALEPSSKNNEGLEKLEQLPPSPLTS